MGDPVRGSDGYIRRGFWPRKDVKGAKGMQDRPKDIGGIALHPGLLDRDSQAALVEAVREIARAAPLATYTTRRGQPLSVRMTSAGRLGWTADRRGYRYEACQPSGAPWPPIPPAIRAVWDAVAPGARPPESCLVNWYGPGTRMGMHQDRDEADMAQPVVSISLGWDALFRVGGVARGGPTRSVWLRSGDVAVMGGEARLVHHGVDRIAEGDWTPLDAPGRVNLTLRVVT